MFSEVVLVVGAGVGFARGRDVFGNVGTILWEMLLDAGGIPEDIGGFRQMLVWESIGDCAKVATRNVAEFLMAGLDDGRLIAVARADRGLACRTDSSGGVSAAVFRR